MCMNTHVSTHMDVCCVLTCVFLSDADRSGWAETFLSERIKPRRSSTNAQGFKPSLSLSAVCLYVSRPLPPSLLSNRRVAATFSPPSLLLSGLYISVDGRLVFQTDRGNECEPFWRTYGAEGRHDPCGDPEEETPTSGWLLTIGGCAASTGELSNSSSFIS